MKISVVIPTYNSAPFIRITLDSVLAQTRPPDEILVLDDGSTDETVSILRSYGPHIIFHAQQNRGVAHARNVLCREARGDLVAFLDHDDIWHPRYLEVQQQRFLKNPRATAFFTLHRVFKNQADYSWTEQPAHANPHFELIEPASFVRRYNSSSGTFYSMSFCCIPKAVLVLLGDEPFCTEVSGVDDCYICNSLLLHGPVVYTPTPLVAYRISRNAQSVNQLKNFQQVVCVFQLLEQEFQNKGDAHLLREFYRAFAGKRRRYAKTLMGVGRIAEARRQLRSAISQSGCPASMGKSLCLFMLTYFPRALQPEWPSGVRRGCDRGDKAANVLNNAVSSGPPNKHED